MLSRYLTRLGLRGVSECSTNKRELLEAAGRGDVEQSWHYACSGCPKEPIVAEVARFLGLAQENLLSSEG
jgi:hypothetical protein